MAELANVELNPFTEADLRDAADKAYKAAPENPFVRADKAASVGVQLDTEAPVGEPGFMGGLKAFGPRLAGAVTQDAPEQLGQAATFFNQPELGGRLAKFAEEQKAARPEWKTSQVAQIASAEDPLSVRGGVEAAAQNLPFSGGAQIAGAVVGGVVGGGLGLLAGGVGAGPGALLGARAGATIASLAALPIFYGSQGQQSKEASKEGLLKSGVPEAEAERQSNIAGHLSGGVEAGFELVGDIPFLGGIWGKLGKPVKGMLVKSLLGNVGAKAAKTFAKIEAGEIGTEMVQQALEDQIEKEYGSQGPGATWKSTLSVVVPTALMSLVPGGLSTAYTFRSNLQMRGALANPEADPEQRAAAAAMIFHSIKGADPVAAHAFDLYAANQIADEKPIELKDDAGYKQDWLGYLQKPETSKVPPWIELRQPTQEALDEGTLSGVAAQLAPTPAERMGIDATAGPTQAAAAIAVDAGIPAAPAEGPTPEDIKAAEKATVEAAKAAQAATQEQEKARQAAWSGLDRRLKLFATEAGDVATKAKESATEGAEPKVPAIHDALIAVSQQHWDPGAATRAMKTALEEKRTDIAYALVERAQRVAEEANQQKPSVPPESGMYRAMKVQLAGRAVAARRVADKLAAMAKLQPETGNAIQVGGTTGVGPLSGGDQGVGRPGEGPGVGQGIEGTPPTQTGGQGVGGPGSAGQPVGPGAVTGPSTPSPVGTGQDQQGNPPNVPGPETPAPGQVTTPAGETTAGPAPTPTPGQIEAGNYKKEHIVAAGFPISIENREGMVRRSKPGVTPAWETTIQKADYGYIKRTEGNDGDHVDAFVKPGTMPEHAGPIFVIDQHGKDGKFDEHKVMLGYDNQIEAISAYKANYPSGWEVGPVSETTNEHLKDWLKNGDMTQRFSERKADPLDTLVDYDKIEETDDNIQPTGRYASGKVRARDALADIDKRLEFARAMRDCLGV